MSDPTVPHLDERKKIMFYESEDKQARFKIRCEFDGISQSQFFRMMITGYIEHDDLIISFLDKCKERYEIQGKQKRNKIAQINKKSKETIKKFSLGDEEIENIFDMIETETNL